MTVDGVNRKVHNIDIRAYACLLLVSLNYDLVAARYSMACSSFLHAD
jgi:hypothetical protein